MPPKKFIKVCEPKVKIPIIKHHIWCSGRCIYDQTTNPLITLSNIPLTKGSWCYILENGYSPDNQVAICKTDENTNHTRMELISLTQALKNIKNVIEEASKESSLGTGPSKEHHEIIINTNSYYVTNSYTMWIDKWELKNFFVGPGNPRPNRDLLLEVYDLKKYFDTSPKISLSINYIDEHLDDGVLKTVEMVNDRLKDS